MIDFTALPRRNKTYAGANGSKIAVVYNDAVYMLKFPGAARLNQDLSYANGCMLSERKKRILDFSLQKLQRRERKTDRGAR